MRNVIAAVLLVFASLNFAQAASDAPAAADNTLMPSGKFVAAFTKGCADDMRTDKRFANFTAKGKQHFCDCSKERLNAFAEQQPQLPESELARNVSAISLTCMEMPIREMSELSCHSDIAPHLRKQYKAKDAQVTSFCTCFSGKAWEASRDASSAAGRQDNPDAAAKACLLQVGLKP